MLVWAKDFASGALIRGRQFRPIPVLLMVGSQRRSGWARENPAASAPME
jgi:hypothetical protein